MIMHKTIVPNLSFGILQSSCKYNFQKFEIKSSTMIINFANHMFLINEDMASHEGRKTVKVEDES